MAKFTLKIFFLLFIPAVCHADNMNSTITCKNHLVIDSSINLEVVDFGFFEDFRLFESFPHIEGNIKVSNNSKQEQYFSTANYLLSGNGIEKTRAYHSSLASHTIDIPPGVKLQPGEIVKVKVYWITDLEIGKKLEAIKLYCNHLWSD